MFNFNIAEILKLLMGVSISHAIFRLLVFMAIAVGGYTLFRLVDYNLENFLREDEDRSHLDQGLRRVASYTLRAVPILCEIRINIDATSVALVRYHNGEVAAPNFELIRRSAFNSCTSQGYRINPQESFNNVPVVYDPDQLSAHLRDECLLRALPESHPNYARLRLEGIVHFASCPLYYRGNLYGYITAGWQEEPPDNWQVEMANGAIQLELLEGLIPQELHDSPLDMVVN